MLWIYAKLSDSSAASREIAPNSVLLGNVDRGDAQKHKRTPVGHTEKREGFWFPPAIYICAHRRRSSASSAEYCESTRGVFRTALPGACAEPKLVVCSWIS
jgi:hypothetical protein